LHRGLGFAAPFRVRRHHSACGCSIPPGETINQGGADLHIQPPTFKIDIAARAIGVGEGFDPVLHFSDPDILLLTGIAVMEPIHFTNLRQGFFFSLNTDDAALTDQLISQQFKAGRRTGNDISLNPVPSVLALIRLVIGIEQQHTDISVIGRIGKDDVTAKVSIVIVGTDAHKRLTQCYITNSTINTGDVLKQVIDVTVDDL
jgi:hypothetical protein